MIEKTLRIRRFFTVPAVVAILAAAVLAAGPSPSRAQPVQVTDDLGQQISLPQPASRIIPLYGAFSEILYDIGAGDRIIARTQADTVVPGIKDLPSVGTHMRPNVEMIIGLRPDLVVMTASRKAETPEISRVLDSGIPVAVFSPKSFGDIFSTVERLGVLSGKQDKASKFVASLRQRLEAIREQLAGITKRRTVFFEVRAEPLTGAGQGSIVQDIIEASGGENIIKNEKPIVRYSLEELLAREPDFYVIQEGPMNKNPPDPTKRAHFDRLRCIRDGKFMFVDELIFSRPGPRCVEAVERLAPALYPEMFRR